MAKIVVGVDASPGGLPALSWAAGEARLRSGRPRSSRPRRRLLLGSVSHAVVLHGRCPVVVVPSGAAERKPPPAPV